MVVIAAIAFVSDLYLNNNALSGPLLPQLFNPNFVKSVVPLVFVPPVDFRQGGYPVLFTCVYLL